MRSGTRSASGETERSGYSAAGDEARSRRDVVGCGDTMVGDCTSSPRGGWTTVAGAGPVRMREGRICSNPCARATFSMDLKY
jgi:hypothetical protein